MNTIEENRERAPFLSFIRNRYKYIIIKEESKEDALNLKNVAECTANLKMYFQIERLNNKLLVLHVSHDVLRYLEKNLKSVFSSQLLQTEKNLIIVEIFRALRNSATITESQNFICMETNILEIAKNIISLKETDDVCIKIILQFLINLITRNSVVAQRVGSEFCNIIVNLLKEGHQTYECSALIYNITLFVFPDLNTVEVIFKLHGGESHNEFVSFFVEHCIKNNEFWSFYDQLKSSDKFIALDRLRTCQIEGTQLNLPSSGVNNIIFNFVKSPNIFFKINNTTIFKDIQEFSLLLEILSCLSSKDEYIQILQQNRDILVTSAALLINFHKLGKESKNIFTPIQKLSESGAEESNNPVFGLKADLIRLIGNMCWKNLQMQNLVRQAEVIPVILDCCNIDSKNPFIIQWCIFAIRNICENNLENQHIILGLRQEGVVSSEVLDEFGITLDTDGENLLKIIPLDSLNIKQP